MFQLNLFIFSLHRVQTESEAHSASIQWVPGAPSSGEKRQGHEADHSPPSCAKVKEDGAVPILPTMSSWHSA
jgi:hypothetical protein